MCPPTPLTLFFSVLLLVGVVGLASNNFWYLSWNKIRTMIELDFVFTWDVLFVKGYNTPPELMWIYLFWKLSTDYSYTIWFKLSISFWAGDFLTWIIKWSWSISFWAEYFLSSSNGHGPLVSEEKIFSHQLSNGHGPLVSEEIYFPSIIQWPWILYTSYQFLGPLWS